MNKELLHWVLIIVLTTIGFFLLTGCANTQMAQQNKADAKYRKQTVQYVESQKNRKQDNQLSGPIEMPQEWIDQWPTLTKEEK
ncbi:hypothetical protein N8Z09_04100 [Methylophilaceae bacterium]|nr:hypothetical protein [Methylophilaceae bacterium]